MSNSQKTLKVKSNFFDQTLSRLLFLKNSKKVVFLSKFYVKRMMFKHKFLSEILVKT